MAQTIAEANSVDEVTHNPTAKDVADVVNNLIAMEADAKEAMKGLSDESKLLKESGFNSKAIKTLCVLKKKDPRFVAHFMRELLLGIEGLNLNPQGDLFDKKADAQQKDKVVNRASRTH